MYDGMDFLDILSHIRCINPIEKDMDSHQELY
jgi:hypothetical protein